MYRFLHGLKYIFVKYYVNNTVNLLSFLQIISETRSFLRIFSSRYVANYLENPLSRKLIIINHRQSLINHPSSIIHRQSLIIINH